jgi:hypothetical protein
MEQEQGLKINRTDELIAELHAARVRMAKPAMAERTSVLR